MLPFCGWSNLECMLSTLSMVKVMHEDIRMELMKMRDVGKQNGSIR